MRAEGKMQNGVMGNRELVIENWYPQSSALRPPLSVFPSPRPPPPSPPLSIPPPSVLCTLLLPSATLQSLHTRSQE
jgi:hypothetical protein